jgi:nucleotide-binding universal stress UspA family protein
MGAPRVQLEAMRGYTSIIAGVDFSSSSPQVLAHAAKLASATGGKLVAAHVISESTIRDWEKTMDRQAQLGGKIEECTSRIAEYVAEHCQGQPASIEVRVGNPQRVLGQIVRDNSAEILILGAHDVSKVRLGSVAARCARLIPADVLLLRDWQTRFFHRIAVCVDYSQTSVTAIDRAITLAKAHSASLEFIHVLFPPTRDPWGRVMDQPMNSERSYECIVRERAQIRLDAMIRPFAGRLAGVPHECIFLEAESPALAIAAHVEAAEIDLTVIGSRDGSWVAEFVLGSNAERLLHDSSTSVLIVRNTSESPNP